MALSLIATFSLLSSLLVAAATATHLSPNSLPRHGHGSRFALRRLSTDGVDTHEVRSRGNANLSARLVSPSAISEAVTKGVDSLVHSFAGTLITKMPLSYHEVTTWKPNSDHLLRQYHMPSSKNKGGVRVRVLPSKGEFRMPITVGDHHFLPLADTGSADIIIDSKANFNPVNSHQTGKSFHAVYQGGADVSGKIYKDDVTIAGITGRHQTFGNVFTGTLIPSSLSPAPSGVLGLGLEAESSFVVNSDATFLPWMSRAAKAGVVQQFAFDLSPNGGTVDFNEDVQSDGLTWMRLAQENNWGVEFSLNGKHIRAGGLLDSGTDTIIGPRDEVLEFFKSTGKKVVVDKGGNVGLYVDCNKGYPLRFNFGGVAITVTGKASLVSQEDGTCVSSLFGAASEDSYILGQPIFFHSYIVFDPVRKRIGMKQKTAATDGSDIGSGASEGSTGNGHSTSTHHVTGQSGSTANGASGTTFDDVHNGDRKGWNDAEKTDRQSSFSTDH